MYKKILAAVNEHVNSEVSARYALRLAKAAAGKVYFCAVAEPGVSERVFRQAEETVMRMFHRARETGVDAESIIDSGDPVQKIEKMVRAENIDLVFAATRREDVKKRFYVRTTARRLSLHLPCSVALVRVVHMGRIHPKEILVSLKARVSHIRERAHFAAMLAAAFGSRIFVYHATKPIRKFFQGEMHLTPVEWEEKIPAGIAAFIGELGSYEVAHDKRLIPGKDGRGITIEAASRRSDLIIMGASVRSLFVSLFRGNPVERALRETPCDLIILNPKHEDK